MGRRSANLAFWWKVAYSKELPDVTIEMCKLWFFWNQSRNSCNVRSESILKRSQRVHSVFPYYFETGLAASHRKKQKSISHLQFSGRNRLRKSKEGQCQVYEAILVLLDVCLAINDLRRLNGQSW